MNMTGRIEVAKYINKFMEEVYNVIMAPPMVHSGNIKTYPVPGQGNVPVVPVDLLGHPSEIPSPSIVGGASGNRVNAKEIYDAMIYVTRMLTRVGTYSYAVYYGTDSGQRLVYSENGKALFNAGYIRSLPSVAVSGVEKGRKITNFDITALFQNCITAWQNSPRHQSVYSSSYCHSSCHSSCHSNCVTGCHVNCYGGSGGVAVVCHTDSTSQCKVCYADTLGTDAKGNSVGNMTCHGDTPNCYSNSCVSSSVGSGSWNDWGCNVTCDSSGNLSFNFN